MRACHGITVELGSKPVEAVRESGKDEGGEADLGAEQPFEVSTLAVF